ncbi:DUF2062 domain-containing protein [Chitinimonas arctica]|uniref:DUF2062 domain-containing protein n=1 Tax=Chitinimonas arctica TaxID=2594795 RepID=A0A516SCD2_9NEIS|nr:DUF2062 domain-containing protein [Chitinimonas arctica]QDQ25807.1 DUF2062 domain-containing protein [Chitinimonas arctica]
MPRKLLRRYLPTRESLDRNALLRRCSPYLSHPNLWHLNRHSVAGGLAVGLFCGLIPGPLQILAATPLAILFRVNLPVAVFGTFFSNPFTIVPIYVAAFGLGRLLTGVSSGPGTLPPLPETDWAHLGDTLSAWIAWGLSMGAPLAIGLVAMAALLAVAGYFLVQWGWRLHVLYALRIRRLRRAA